jgi:myosin heavy subunit
LIPIPLSPSGSSFEEEPSDIHDAYSGDFENEYSFSMSGKRVETPKKVLSVQIQIPQSSTTRTNQPNGAVAAATAPVLLPSVEIQTLQAELSLQKLSKEIVHLRNQQRESLRARRMEVLDKKKRAQARRESYLREMSELQKQLRESHETKQKLEENLQMKDQKLTIVETNSELLSGQNQEMNELIQNLQKEIAEARKSYKELQEKNEEIEKVKRDEKERWNAEKEVLRNQKLSCELQIEVLTRSNEKNEQRYWTLIFIVVIFDLGLRMKEKHCQVTIRRSFKRDSLM